MEKEAQPDSMATVTIKPEYPPSEVYSSEPPPAYHRSQSSAVQVARIVAITVVLVSVILGSFWLASAYVQANASCKQLEQELALLSEAADRFQPPPLPPQAEALVQNESQQQQVKSEDVPKKSKDIETNSIETTDNSDSSSESGSNESDDYDEKQPIKFKLPLQLDFDDLAGALIEKNQRSRMNCIVEKKRAEEVVDHQPKTLRLPFGLNLTTDPRYEHVSGERMAIFCESGNIQRNAPQQNDDDNDDGEEETIMIQPVMIPIPQTHFPTHMAQQMPPPQQPQYHQVHPMETMRPPMPPPVMQQQNQFPPNQVLHHIAQQIVAQKIMEAQRAREQQLLQQQQQQQQEQEQNQEEATEPRMIPQRYPMMPQSIQLPEEVLTQLNRLPNRDVIVAVSEPESDENNEDEQQSEQQQQQQEFRMMPQEVQSQQKIRMMPQDVQQQQQEVRMMPQMVQQQVRMVQEPRQSAAEMNGRQSYARGLPVHIPIHMIQQEQQEPQAEASEETRPHYVQPRSLRSVDALVDKNQKRVKRCSCDCAC